MAARKAAPAKAQAPKPEALKKGVALTLLRWDGNSYPVGSEIVLPAGLYDAYEKKGYVGNAAASTTG